MDQGSLLVIIIVVHLGVGLFCGVFLSKKRPVFTHTGSFSLTRFITKNSDNIFILMGTVLGLFSQKILTDDYYITMIDVILGLLAASGLIFTFILGHLLNTKKGLRDTIINLDIKKAEQSPIGRINNL